MRVDEFDFDLPRDLIAEHPIEPRDASRLLVISDCLDDRRIADLPHLLRAGDVLVANDTRVIPAQLTGTRGAATIDATLHRDLGGGRWRAFVKGARRLKPGDVVTFGDGFTAEVTTKEPEGDVTLRFNSEGDALRQQLERHGRMPLPPYIHRGRDGETRDKHDYQTMFASAEGAVAAPTAGLHFTPALIEAVKEAGIGLETVTLHVGAGTFLPVKVDDTNDHRMHAEYGIITAETAARLNAARAKGGRIVSIGTTSLRVLESATGEDGIVNPFAAETSIFITPGYRFRAIDVLLTNFHLPRSTLFMLVSAFAGLERMKAAYAHAIEARYRFFSYGDACLLFPAVTR
jgi:S-adenosylmethionine:tRNA ribosyltransferase-isomerase